MSPTIDVIVFPDCGECPSEEAKKRQPRKLPDGSIGVVYKKKVYPVYRPSSIDAPFRINLDDPETPRSSCQKALDFDEVHITKINNSAGNGSKKIEVDFEWHSSRIEEILTRSINPNATSSCPICHGTGQVRDILRHYFYHLLCSGNQENEEVVKKFLGELEKFESREDHTGIKRITEQNKLNDLKNEWRGALPDAKTPGSNLRKFGKNKRRP